MPRKELVLDYLLIAAGTLILALGLNLFLVPIKLSSGGISSIGTILLHLFRIPLSVTNLVLNTLLFLLGYRYLGRASVVKTLAGVLLLSLFLQLTSYLPVYTDDLWMATIAGGLLVGVGIGLVVRREGSTGGSDFAALMLHRLFPHISVAVFIMVIDCAIILLAGIVFRSITIMLYSMVSLYISVKVTDLILELGSLAKSVSIISPRSAEIADVIMARFERGVTGVYTKGMYSGGDSMTLLCVVSPKELPALVRTIKQLDPCAFVVISDARKVLGEGFQCDMS